MPPLTRSLCAKVPIKKGEYYRKTFFDEKLIDKNLMIKRIDSFLYIPLSRDPNSSSKQGPRHRFLKDKNIEYIEDSFESYPKHFRDYKSLLTLPNNLKRNLPTSYDIIGSIAVIKLQDPLKKYADKIGKAIMKIHKSIRSVALDEGVQGNYRIRKIKIIAGEKNTVTIHKEYGVRFILDISKVYYSPRLGREHFRIAKLVRPDEVVLDMFAGIGPFSIMISKYSKASQIYAIDINKHAMEYLIKNIDLNKVQNIFPLEGDAKRLIRKVPIVDRVIMNLPLNGEKFLDLAFSKMNINGIIHHHKMVDMTKLDDYIKELENQCAVYGFEPIKIERHNVGSFSAKINHYCFDMSVKKL